MVVVAIAVGFELSLEEKRKIADLKLGVPTSMPQLYRTFIRKFPTRLSVGLHFSGVHSQ